ncbi:MAG TPA: hypothetical protein VF613_12735 [Longimicrobium sp.]
MTDQGGAAVPPVVDDAAVRAAQEKAAAEEIARRVDEKHRRAQAEQGQLKSQAEDALRELQARAPKTLNEAILKYRDHQRVDPYPGIRPGLLSCSSFCAYIADAGLMFPYKFDAKSVQLASLDLPLLGTAIRWNEKHEERVFDIEAGTPLVLPPNSITFVTLEPYLQLPEYIALRFNLRVRHVYQGLLLGTGPLIDPGYQGYLAVPLHNLTNHEYTFFGGEALVAVEFTKIDPESIRPRPPAEEGNEERVPPQQFAVPFPEPELPRPDPSRLELHPIKANLRKARVALVESSLPAINARVAEQERQMNEWTQRITFGGALAIIGLLLAIGGIMWQATNEMRTVATRERETVDRFEAQRKGLADSLNVLQTRLRETRIVACARVNAAEAARIPDFAAVCTPR